MEAKVEQKVESVAKEAEKAADNGKILYSFSLIENTLFLTQLNSNKAIRNFRC